MNIKDHIKVFQKDVDCARIKARDLLLNKEVRITSNFNGQPHGHSRPSLKGKVFSIKNVHLEGWQCSVWDGNYDHCYIDIREVEFL